MTHKVDKVRTRRLRCCLGILVSLWLGLQPASPAWAESVDDAPLWSLGWITDTQTPECEWITRLINTVPATASR